jgi:hypothetical protein
MGVVTTAATPANAADCSFVVRDHSNGTDSVRSGKAINVGPSSTCADAGVGSGRYSWNLWCWEFSTSGGNVFWYGRGTDGNGWVNEANLVYNNNARNLSNRCSTS